MRTEEEFINDICIVKLFARIDISCSSELKELVLSMIEENKLKLIFDMNEVEFIDSSGLGMLVACLRALKNAGGDLKIINLNSRTRQIFDMTRMDRVFEIFNCKEDAADSLSEQ